MCIRFAICAIGVLLAGVQSQASMVAASFDAPLAGSYTVGFSTSPGQNNSYGMTFLSQKNGALDSLQINMGWNTGHPSNLFVSFFTVDGSDVPDTLIATRTVSQSDLAATVGGADYGFVTIDFSGGPYVFLSSGQKYAWTIVSEETGNYNGAPAMYPPFGLAYSDSIYPSGGRLVSSDGGTAWNVIDDYESYPFAVNVVVPAPGAGVPILGLAGLGAIRRRRRA